MKLPVIEKKTIKLSGRVLEYGLLGGEVCKQILDKHNKKIKHPYYRPGEKMLNVYSFDNKTGLIVGGNLFSNILMNQTLREFGFRITIPQDLSIILERGGDLGLETGNYINFALVSRNYYPGKFLTTYTIPKEVIKDILTKIIDKGYSEDRVPLPAGTLERTVKEIKPGGYFIKIVPLSDLYLREDKDLHHPLGVAIKKNARKIPAQGLNNENHGKRFSKIDENAIPIFKLKGKHILHTSAIPGIFRLSFRKEAYLDKGFDIIGLFKEIEKNIKENPGRLAILAEKELGPNIDREIAYKLEAQKLPKDLIEPSIWLTIERLFDQKIKKLENKEISRILMEKTKPHIKTRLVLDSSCSNLGYSNQDGRTLVVKETKTSKP